jgi:hypothetical protein
MTIKAIECEHDADAIQYADASGFGEPVSLNGKSMVVPQKELDRIGAARVSFAYLFWHVMPNGEHRIMTVPVN